MEVTEVRIKLMDEPGDRLKAFCSVTFDNCFVIRDLKIIEGATGPFVAMPSRKLTAHCRKCGSKNHLRAAYCNQCGERQTEGRAPKDADGRAKLYADIAHPINSSCREMIQARVIEEFTEELELSRNPEYVSRYDDFDFSYEDLPDEKPARIDPSHVGASTSPPHSVQTENASTPSMGSKPHFNQQETDRGPSSRSGALEKDPPPTAGGFGAGILPGN